MLEEIGSLCEIRILTIRGERGRRPEHLYYRRSGYCGRGCHHPHVHMIVPGGGISLDGARWVASRSNFLVHVDVLARLFQGKMLAMLMHAHTAGELKFFNTHAGLADKRTFKRFIAPLRHTQWVVYCKAPFAGPAQVLR